MNEDDLFMNDTLDNFTFSDVNSANGKERDTKYQHISLDDSSFLKVLSINLNEIEKNTVNYRNQTPGLCEQEVLKENTKNIRHNKQSVENSYELEYPKRVSGEILISTKSPNKSIKGQLQKNGRTTASTDGQFKENFFLSKEKITPSKKKNLSKLEDLKNDQSNTLTHSVCINQTKSYRNIDNISFNEFEKTTLSSPAEESYRLSHWGLPDVVLERYKSKKIEKMFPWQVECLSNPKVLNDLSNLIYSAPTSAGKTLVAEILALKTIFERKKKVIFILPFVSIVREKMYYFQDILGTSGIRAEGFMGSYNPPGGFSSIQMAICTIEKANSLINRLLEEGRLSEIGAILVDEMHLLGDPHRGYLLELLLTKLRYISVKDKSVEIQIIGMSATLPNLNQLAKWLNAELYSTTFRPIPLHEHAIVCGEVFDKNLKSLRKLEHLPELGVDTDNILQLCLETIKDSCSVLIFCPYKNWCENLAQQISSAFLKIGNTQTAQGELLRSQIKSDLILEVLEQLKFCPVGLDKILHKTVSFGVAFHHAGLTMDERDIIEGAFRNGAIRILVATSTLSSGVNLPARRVLIRSPTFHGKPIDLLTYRQMIGRAGRMGKDTMGESFLICQKNDYKIAKELMSGELPAVESCLEGAGKLKRAILEVIASGVASTPDDVTTFTRCTLLAITENEREDFKDPIDEAVNFLKNNEFIRLQALVDGKEKYCATSLGKACLSSSIAPDEGLALFTELEKARQCFVLETELHLIYLVTPYSACYSWGNIDWMFFLDLWDKLPVAMKRVGDLVGIREAYIVNATRGRLDANSSKTQHKLMIHKRFFVALALQDLVNEVPLGEVCVKFSCNRGMLQSLQQTAATFAGMVTSFSRQLGWSSVEILLSQFQDRMQFGVSRDLLDLMHLPSLNGKIARTLYNAGIETVIQLANSDMETVETFLCKAGPFESSKEREGETEFENKQRNKLRTVWVTGKEGLTEREAAELLITEARNYLKIEMGLKEAKWSDEESMDDQPKQESQQDGEREESVRNGDQLASYNTEEVKRSSLNSENVLMRKNSISSINNDSVHTSLSSLNLNISSSTPEESLQEETKASDSAVANIISDANPLYRESTSSNNNGRHVDDLSISESSSLFSNISFTRLEENIITDDKNNPISHNVCGLLTKKSCEVSELLRSNSPMELNISESSVFSSFGNAVNKSKSSQSIIEDSFSLSLSLSYENCVGQEKSYDDIIEDFESEGIFDKVVQEIHLSQEFECEEGRYKSEIATNISPIEDKTKLNSIKNNRFLLRKRSRENSGTSSDESILEATPTKKSRVFKDTSSPLKSTIKKISRLSIIPQSVEKPKEDFSKMNIVCVSNQETLIDHFFTELEGKKSFSLSVACNPVEEMRPVIGANIVDVKTNPCSAGKEYMTFQGRKVEGFAISWGDADSYFLTAENTPTGKKVLKLLKQVFTNEKLTIRMFNAKETIKTLKLCCDIDFSCKIEDPKVTDWLLDAEGKEKSLQMMVGCYCEELVDISRLCGEINRVGSIGLDLSSTVEPKMRASVEALVTWHLVDALNKELLKQMPKCNDKTLPSLISTHDLEMRTILCLANMEMNGMSADKTSLQNLVDLLKNHQNAIEKKAYSLAGRRFNFTSSTDVARVIGIYKGKKVSIRKQVLEQNKHPISDLILQWRKVNFTLTKMVHPLIRSCQNNKIYGCYNSYTATGRITMHEPNIQMVTKDFNCVDPITRKNIVLSCRSAFRVPEGQLLVSADYCQLELRILTYLSKDKLLMSILGKPGDIFKSIAAKWNGVAEDLVDDNMRQNTKQLCYGIIYGMGAKTLADQLVITEDEAAHFMESFRNTYSGIKDFIKQTIDSCKEKGYVETITGRRRYLPHISHVDSSLKSQAERQAVNTTVQGSAADIVKNAMIIIEDKVNLVFKKSRYQPKLTLHLHDELIYEVPEKYLEKSIKVIRKGMENSAWTFGHFPVKVKIGKSWGELTEYGV